MRTLTEGNTPEGRAKQHAIISRYMRFQKAEKKRRRMSENDLAEEESRLIFEARRMAKARGFSVKGIGDNWTREPQASNEDLAQIALDEKKRAAESEVVE